MGSVGIGTGDRFSARVHAGRPHRQEVVWLAMCLWRGWDSFWKSNVGALDWTADYGHKILFLEVKVCAADSWGREGC